MHAEHAGRGSDIVLVPTPSNDVDDPLNWTPRRKALAASCIVVYTVTVGIASAAIYSVLEPISEDTGLALADLNAGTGYMVGALANPVVTLRLSTDGRSPGLVSTFWMGLPILSAVSPSLREAACLFILDDFNASKHTSGLTSSR